MFISAAQTSLSLLIVVPIWTLSTPSLARLAAQTSSHLKKFENKVQKRGRLKNPRTIFETSTNNKSKCSRKNLNVSLISDSTAYLIALLTFTLNLILEYKQQASNSAERVHTDHDTERLE